ncbi:MAG: M14 family zinc carboxypeptidase [Proteobacteria bacterium]|nr:M14 family zinc carboxypeptidase [Pseudomonadota bacterium]
MHLPVAPLLGILGLAACAHATAARPSLVTVGETSGYTRTGRYDEVLRLCAAYAHSYAGVACETIGHTSEDRPLVALHVTRAGGARPTIYVQAGIHPGEIEGKDAGFWFLRELLDGTVAPGALAAVNVVFVPVLNPDGHERFGPNQRVNQRGPVEGGFRSTATRQNLNRDFVKADAPETRAVLDLVARLDPMLLVDLHTTDGAKFEHDIAIVTAPVAPRGDQLDETAAALATQVATRLTALGHLPMTFYPSFVVDDDPTSGFEVDDPPPRFGHFYMATRSRLAVLVETHSWRTYRERTRSTFHALQAIFELATRDATAWRAVERDADAADRRLPGTMVPLAWRPTKQSHPIDFRGYAYARQPSEISGAPWIVYDETTPQTWQLPLFDQLEPSVTIAMPKGGYVVDGGFAPLVGAILDRHHLRYVRLGDATVPRTLEVFRATKVVPATASYEGHVRVTVEGTWTAEVRALERGALFVPIDQPGARLIAHLFEPTLPDALVQWGLFATVFERKEYMEAYVAEQVARTMLAADPTLRVTFEAALAADPALAKDPARRLDWFYRRSPAWDERVNLLPVYRTQTTLRP